MKGKQSKQSKDAARAAAAAGRSPTRPPAAVRQARFAQNFSQIVAVLMKDAGFKNLRLAELEWLVLPAVRSGQWRLAQARAEARPTTAGATSNGSYLVPSAVAIWATVSSAVDARLAANLDKPLLLEPDEWASGEIVWLIALAGDRRAMPSFLKHLHTSAFKSQEVKLRDVGADGKTVVVSTLAHKLAVLAKRAVN